MPTLIICKNLRDYQVVPFTKSIKIGRNSDNDIVLNSLGVSRFHGSIRKKGDNKYTIHDEGSKNFIWVGKEKIQQYDLSHGVSFRILDYLFTFIDDSPEENSELKVLNFSGGDDLNSGTLLITDKLNHEIETYNAPQEKFSVILKYISKISSLLDYEKLLEEALHISLKILGTDKGFLALRNNSGKLNLEVQKGFDTDGAKRAINQNIIKKVISGGCSIVTKADNTSSLSCSESIICIPLLLPKKVIGCIYLDYKKNGDPRNGELEILKILSHYIAISIENAKFHKKLKDESTTLKKNLSLKEQTVIESEKDDEIV